MCLIIHKPAGVDFTDEQLRDFYKQNDDGYGFMHSEGGTLKIHKSLGDDDAFIAAFRARVQYECLIHLRMRTHGEIDLDNCHPYEVLTRAEGGEMGGVWMMHNGVLSHGNAADKNFSDTWHYARDWLAPLLRKYPELLLDKTFQGLVGNDIGMSNKFVFMTSRGDVVIINREQGTQKDGCWFSNTYAWGTQSDWEYEVGSYTAHAGAHDYHSRHTSYAGEYYNRGADALELETPAGGLDDESHFFSLLDEFKFYGAYKELNLDVVAQAYDESREEMFELEESIKNGSFFAPDDDELVICYVRDLAGLAMLMRKVA
jgi:hypothetical protein